MAAASIQPANETTVRQAARLLAQGELVAVPTETVYGLAADGSNARAVEKIFRAKGRPAHNPLILHFPTATAARAWINLESADAAQQRWLEQAWEKASAFWPGPLTVVVPRSPRVSNAVTAGADTVAVRVPSHPVMQALLQQCEFPLAAPSANPSNYVSPTRAEHVQASLGDRVAMILDGGPCRCGVESTIIRLQPPTPQLLRPGALPLETLESSFGPLTKVPLAKAPLSRAPSGASSRASRGASAEKGRVEAMPAPGMLSKHYAPRKPIRLVGQADPGQLRGRAIARLAFAPLDADQAAGFRWVRTLSKTGNLDEVAQRLFAALREADQTDCDLILVDRCEPIGIGRAIMDRLHRAAADAEPSG
jgi:L-threonylcarbamoyladenylate synthase